MSERGEMGKVVSANGGGMLVVAVVAVRGNILALFVPEAIVFDLGRAHSRPTDFRSKRSVPRERASRRYPFPISQLHLKVPKSHGDVALNRHRIGRPGSHLNRP